MIPKQPGDCILPVGHGCPSFGLLCPLQGFPTATGFPTWGLCWGPRHGESVHLFHWAPPVKPPPKPPRRLTVTLNNQGPIDLLNCQFTGLQPTNTAYNLGAKCAGSGGSSQNFQPLKQFHGRCGLGAQNRESIGVLREPSWLRHHSPRISPRECACLDSEQTPVQCQTASKL